MRDYFEARKGNIVGGRAVQPLRERNAEGSADRKTWEHSLFLQPRSLLPHVVCGWETLRWLRVRYLETLSTCDLSGRWRWIP